MTAIQTVAVYLDAAFTKVANGFALCGWMRLGASALWLVPSVLPLVAFAWLLTLAPSTFAGRACAVAGRARRRRHAGDRAPAPAPARGARQSGWEMRRHPPARRLGLLALYLLSREAAPACGLVDLLIETVQRSACVASRRVLSALTGDIERVHGKERLLVALAEPRSTAPTGRCAS